MHRPYKDIKLENGSHYRASELIYLFFLIFFFLNSNLNPNQIQIKSKSNPNQIQIKSNLFFYLFLCLQGQPELCGSYHHLQSCFTFILCLHGQPEPFGSCIVSSLALLSSSVSMANLGCLLATTFSRLSFLSNSFSSPRFDLLRVARCCFLWSSVSDVLFFSSCIFFVLHLALFNRPDEGRIKNSKQKL